MKNSAGMIFALVLLLSMFSRVGASTSEYVKDSSDHIVVDFGGGLLGVIGLRTVDPTHCLSTDEMTITSNVYETLVSFDRENPNEFVPCLATTWEISSDGLTYTFEIRQNVLFHNGAKLTTEDVQYSFERALVYSAGISYLLFESLLGTDADIYDPDIRARAGNVVGCNETHVWFNLAATYLPGLQNVFLQILSMPGCAAIFCKSWCTSHGDWPGNWDSWQEYARIGSRLDYPDHVMCGTGPYKFDFWNESGISFVEFDDYWGGWPAQGCRGYVTRGTFIFTSNWEERRDAFLAGNTDILTYVPPSNLSQVWNISQIRCVYPLPLLQIDAFFFNFNISKASPFMGVDGGLPPSIIAEEGIPPNFFSDLFIRKAFAYCFNYTEFIDLAYGGEATRPAGPIPDGIPFYNPKQERYSFDMSQAIQNFRAAWKGQVWEQGFTLTICYPKEENETLWGLMRRELCRIFKENVESINEKFHIQVDSVPPTGRESYVERASHKELPVFLVGWAADLPDPHNFVVPFMTGYGVFSGWQSYANGDAYSLTEQGASTSNQSRREEIYYELQRIYHEDCPSVCTDQPFYRHWEQSWVQGWYYNPLRYSSIYFYHLWKEDLPSEDLSMDGEINIVDISMAALAYRSSYQHGSVLGNWNSRVDLDKNGKINIVDITTFAIKYGYVAPPWADRSMCP